MIRARAAGAAGEIPMRRSWTAPILFAAALCAAGCQSGGSTTAATTAAKPAPKETQRFEPAKGVKCDRSSKVCEWKGGPSVGLTRLFFGDGPGDALAPQMASAGYKYDPIFKPSARVSCDTLVTTCYDEGGASDELTRSYFGSNAASKLGSRRRGSVQRYGQFITCDRVSNVCYDRLGAGVGITRLYIGETESDALLERLRSNL